jgi:hypothetical protein
VAPYRAIGRVAWSEGGKPAGEPGMPASAEQGNPRMRGTADGHGCSYMLSGNWHALRPAVYKLVCSASQLAASHLRRVQRES